MVALTHGHSDHVLGLPGFIASRKFAKGAQDKPFTVVFPEGNNGVLAVRELLARMWSATAFPVTWVPIRAGGEFRLGKTRVLQAFATSHGGSEPTLGYAVLEERRRLRPEYSGLSEHEIRELVRQGGRDALMEGYRQVRFAHTGDAMPIDPALVAGADILIHDATFLDAGGPEVGHPRHNGRGHRGGTRGGRGLPRAPSPLDPLRPRRRPPGAPRAGRRVRLHRRVLAPGRRAADQPEIGQALG